MAEKWYRLAAEQGHASAPLNPFLFGAPPCASAAFPLFSVPLPLGPSFDLGAPPCASAAPRLTLNQTLTLSYLRKFIQAIIALRYLEAESLFVSQYLQTVLVGNVLIQT